MMGELLLTLDTSTPVGSVAVSRGERLLGEVLLDPGTTHSDRLLPALRQLLDDLGMSLEQVDAYGVVTGPGSFTGLRVGIATVKGLALATGRPALGVSSLATLAMALPFCTHQVCALLDARKQEVYAGVYRTTSGHPEVLREPAAISPERLLEQLDGEAVFVGSGVDAYRTLIVRQWGGRAHFAPWPMHTPRAALAAPLALAALRSGEGASAAALLPTYLRLSEAELAWAQRAADGAIEG